MIDPIVRPAAEHDAVELRRIEREARRSLEGVRGADRWLATNPPIDLGWEGPIAAGEVFVAVIDDVVVGYISSGSCAALAPVIDELKKLTVLAVCGTPRIFEESARTHVFRTMGHATGDNVAAAPHLQPRRMILGGSFTDEASALASAPKKTLPAVTAFVTVGFRCAMDIPTTDDTEQP